MIVTYTAILNDCQSYIKIRNHRYYWVVTNFLLAYYFNVGSASLDSAVLVMAVDY